MAKRSARATAKEARRSRPQPRKRQAAARPWGWVDVVWVGITLLIAKVLIVLTLGHPFTALMPADGVVGVRIVLLIVFYLFILMVLAYRAHCRNMSFAEAYRLDPRKADDYVLAREEARSDVAENLEKSGGVRTAHRPAYFSWWKSALAVVGFFLVLRTFAVLYTYVTGQLGWVTPPSESLTDLFGTTLWGLAAAIISIMVLAPFIEELVFRVVMFESFARKMPIIVAAIVQALIFSLYHFSLWAALPNFLLALACVYLMLKCRTSLPAIFLHVLYNSAVVVAAFYVASL